MGRSAASYPIGEIFDGGGEEGAEVRRGRSLFGRDFREEEARQFEEAIDEKYRRRNIVA